MDEFAQTRPAENLFEEDFTPIAEPKHEPQPPTGPRGGRNIRGGRGRARGRASYNGVAPAAPAPTQKITTPPVTSESPAVTAKVSNGTTVANEQPSDVKSEARREPAVKGDRSNTGGVKKVKPTEEELTAKLEAMKIKNAAAEAAHARQLADKESFAELERAEKAKRFAENVRRQEERQNRREMDKERERNRTRKMNAAGGREWDAEKNEEEFASRGGSATDNVRGSRGAAISRGIGRERGRGRGRGRGRERTDLRSSAHAPQAPQSSSEGPPNPSDFPALAPTEIKDKEGSSKAPTITLPNAKPNKTSTKDVTVEADGKASWAEEMESSAKPTES